MLHNPVVVYEPDSWNAQILFAQKPVVDFRNGRIAEVVDGLVRKINTDHQPSGSITKKFDPVSDGFEAEHFNLRTEGSGTGFWVSTGELKWDGTVTIDWRTDDEGMRRYEVKISSFWDWKDEIDAREDTLGYAWSDFTHQFGMEGRTWGNAMSVIFSSCEWLGDKIGDGLLCCNYMVHYKWIDDRHFTIYDPIVPRNDPRVNKVVFEREMDAFWAQDSIDRDAVYDSAAEQLHEREMHIWERRSADAIWSQEWVEPPRSPYYDSQYDDD